MAKSRTRRPGPLASAARRFDMWRDNRTTRRIPAELWSLATRLGGQFGVSRTARALRVQYYTLKERVDAAASPEANEPEPPPAFVEILTEPSATPSECRVEYESVGGAKMRIVMKGASPADLAELSRVFLEPRA